MSMQHLKYWWIAHVQEAGARSAKMESNNVTISDLAPLVRLVLLFLSQFLSDFSICPFPFSSFVFVAGHQLDSPAARPTNSCFNVCKVIERMTNQPLSICSINCQACNARTTNQPPCSYVVLIVGHAMLIPPTSTTDLCGACSGSPQLAKLTSQLYCIYSLMVLHFTAGEGYLAKIHKSTISK